MGNTTEDDKSRWTDWIERVIYSGTASIDSNSWLRSFSSSDSLAKTDQKRHSYSNIDIACNDFKKHT